MDGQNGQYIQDDVEYDDLMRNAGWPAPGYPTLPNQDPYARYQTTQSPYDHFPELSQPSYPQIPYSNSTYPSQFQNTRAPDYTSTPYVDPSLQSSQVSYGGLNSSFAFAPNAIDATIAPQSLQYEMAQPSSMNRQVSASAFQRPTNTMHRSPYSMEVPEQTPLYFGHQGPVLAHSSHPTYTSMYANLPAAPSNNVNVPRQDTAQVKSDPIASVPHVQQIQSRASPQVQILSKTTNEEPIQPRASPQVQIQNPLRITDEELYNTKDSSSRPGFALAPFIAWLSKPIEVQLGPKNTLPKYQPRKSVNGKGPIPGFDASQSLKPGQISSKKRGRPRKDLGTPISKYKGTSHKPKVLVGKTNYLREDGSLSAKSPSTPSESSSEEEESSTEEESEYEEEVPVMDISTVRGPSRPVDVSQAARWDAVGIVWKNPYSNTSSDAVKEAIEKYGSLVNNLRAEIKANSTKIEAAASNPTEVKKLEGERDVLLESLYQVIDAANVHGYPPVVENLGGHQKFVHGLTTTLMECIKAADFDGKLPKAVLILLAKFRNLTDELLTKLKFEGIQKRWNKKGNEETKGYIATILANTTNAKEKAAKAVKVEGEKKTQDHADQTKRRPTASVTSTAASSTKRPHDGDGANGKPAKKFASDTPTSGPKTTLVKKPTANLLGIATKPTPKPVVKKVEPAPPTESKLGALLASIAKAPEPPKAPAAPARPPETPEQKAKRERKESRRHLRVKFKDDNELTEIRYFKHEQAEDEGRQDEMLKDAHDDRLEGMMHKKRVLEIVDDDDDDYQPPDVELPYSEPPKINFNSLAKSTKFGPSYTTRGGDLTVKSAEQKTQKAREESELMVVYTDPADIPPSPKEPLQDVEDYQPEPHLKEPTEPWLLQRVKEIHQYGPENASQIFLSRREEQMFKEIRENRARDSLPKANTSTNQPASVSNLLQQLKDTHSNKGAATTTKMDPTEYAKLLSVVNYLKGKPYPPVEPPEWMTEMGKNEWWEGYYRDNPGKKRELDERIQAQIAASQFQPQAQTQQYQPTAPSMLNSQFQQLGMQAPTPQMAYPQAVPQGYTANQSTDVAAQVQAYIAAYQQQQQTAAAATAAPPQATQAFDYNAWVAQQTAVAAAQSQNHGYGQTTQPQPAQFQAYTQGSQPQPDQNHNAQSYNNENRWDGSKNSEWESERHSAGRNKESKKRYEGKNPTTELFDEKGEYIGKKRPCTFWLQGKCAKGAKCTFLHETPS